MKKFFLSAVMSVSVLFGANNASAQVFEEGAAIVSLGYGIPNLAKTLFKLGTLGESDNTAKGIGPIHGKFEYGITDKLGIGAVVNFSNASLENPYTGFDNGKEVEYLEKNSLTSFNILLRLNWHFVDHDKVDFYYGFGVGYNRFKWGYENNDPDVDVDAEVDALNELTNLLPIGFESTLGLRYLFTDNLGAYLEVGYSKSLLQFGVCYKLQ
jgi:opacity protein-like surface antigen